MERDRPRFCLFVLFVSTDYGGNQSPTIYVKLVANYCGLASAVWWEYIRHQIAETGHAQAIVHKVKLATELHAIDRPVSSK